VVPVLRQAQDEDHGEVETDEISEKIAFDRGTSGLGASAILLILSLSKDEENAPGLTPDSHVSGRSAEEP
jgi:hypothetical protein